ncbi:S-adenosylmethionine mitochondrial carrier protein-like, partial [Acipenser oxyrinchus oxyrinchus]
MYSNISHGTIVYSMCITWQVALQGCVWTWHYSLWTPLKHGSRLPRGFTRQVVSGNLCRVPSAAVGSFPNAAAFFVTYEYMKTLLGSSSSPYMAPVKHMAAASLGEIIACLIRVPTEVIKQRTQACPSS